MAEKKDINYKFHFIPNTHWDREWLYDFQETRMFLVEFMDKLLDIFKNYPDYKTYLLDSQTVAIEDYLEIRPERKSELIQLVKDNRLQIGPWYTLPEEHLVNGESLIRNLVVGHQLSKDFGGTMKVGYSPFSYGQASQMPQIYQGFDIDTILFYHGIQPTECDSEFIFEGPDGSQLFASRMGSNARYNFFFSVFRPAVYGKEAYERNYSPLDKGLPFHLSSTQHCMDHHILIDPPKTLHKDKLADLIDGLKNAEIEHCTTEHIACMQGMDSTQPDVSELQVVNELKKIIGDEKIFHSSLPEWIKAVKESVDWEKLTVLKGERRTPRKLGTRVHLYGDVTSTRTRMKRKNTLAEQELQRKAEPFAVIANMFGMEYPKTYLKMAWKYLLQSHPHDSIAGTGVDQIETDVHHRLDQSRNLSAGIIRRSLQAIQMNIDNSDLSDNEFALTIFNPTPYKRSEVVTAVLDIPIEFELNNYGIFDGVSKEAVEFQEESRYEHRAIMRHLGDATMEMPSMRVHVHIPLKDIPALGYKTLVVKPLDDFTWAHGSLVTSQNRMENDFLKVDFNRDGTVNILDKETNKEFNNLHYFEDNGEAGHAWRHVSPAYDRIISSVNSAPKIELVQSGPYLSQYQVTYTLQIPVRLKEGKGNDVRRLDADGDDAGRSEETRELTIKSLFTLTKESKGLSVNTKFFNSCEDHRLRVMFPTELAATHSSAEEPFDVIEREIDRGEGNPWRNTWNPTHPHQRFVDVSDKENGLAIINDGLREYEVTDNSSRTIGLTLMRAFEIALTTVAWKWERHPEMKGSQVLGEHEYNYHIFPHTGNWDKGNVMREADKFNVPIELAQAGPHEGILPKEKSFVEITSSELMLSSLKIAERNGNVVLRIYNPTERDVESDVVLFKNPSGASFLNMNEEVLDKTAPAINGNTIKLKVKAKKIITLEIIF